MKKQAFLLLFAVSAVLIGLSSCSLDDSEGFSTEPTIENGEAVKSGGDVRYTLSGNYSGTLDFSPILHNNMPISNLKVVALPWEQTFQVPDTSSFIGGYINGFYGDGLAHEEVNFKMYFKDRLIESVTRFANSRGNINLPMEVLFFEFYDPDKTISSANTGKTVRYETETNFDRPFNIRYRVSDSSWENRTIDQFPWSYSFTTNAQSTTAALYTYELVGNELDGVMNQNDTIIHRLLIDGIVAKTAIISKIGPETFFSEGQIHHEFD